MSSHPTVAVITGAARGIGLAIARRLAAEGHTPVLIDLSDSVINAARGLAGPGRPALGIQADVADEKDALRALTKASDTLGPLGILVNNAALTDVHRPWQSVTPHDWDRVMAANIKSAFLCSRFAADAMTTAGWGRIVNVSSVTALTGQRHLIDYVSSKAGLIGFTRSLARELGGQGITVNGVIPGSIRTEAELKMFPDQEALDAQQMAVQAIPRRGAPEDVASAVAFFCRDDASFITGQSLTVDGGWIMH